MTAVTAPVLVSSRTERNLGSIEYAVEKDGTKIWKVKARADVLQVLRKVVASSHHIGPGVMGIPATVERTADLEWISQRYPLLVLSPRQWEERITIHRARLAAVAEMLDDATYIPREFNLQVPPRQYQRLGADLWLRVRNLLVADEVGLGKDQPLDAQVLTPTGWRAIGDLRIGDRVVDPDGGEGAVTGVYPQGVRQVYRVATKDGASTECSETHLWGIYSGNDRWRDGAMRVMELKDFMLDLHARKGGNNTSKWFLPLPSPVEFDSAASLPVNPYLLGVLIGDAGMSGRSIRLMNPDVEIVERVRASLPPGVVLQSENRPDHYCISRTATSGANPLTDVLRDVGLMGKLSVQKRIPPAYLHAPAPARLELLRGLMDTDGDATTDGCCTFNTSSPGLRDDVLDLVRGLGGIASVSDRPEPKYQHDGETRTGQPAYRVNVRLAVAPFYLSRKAERWHLPYMARAIASVEPTREVETVCIRVSTKRSLYVTDGHMVTHNTATALCALTAKETRPALVVTMAHLTTQWARETRRFLPGGVHVHVLRKGRPYPLADMLGMPDVIISSYTKLDGWAQALAGKVKSVIFDECQELRRKGTGQDKSKKYAAAKVIADASPMVLGLSATPIYNHGSEIHNVMSVVAPGVLGDWPEFKSEWCEASYESGKESMPVKHPASLGEYMRARGAMLLRTRKDVGRELPSVTIVSQATDADLTALASVDDRVAELARLMIEGNHEERFTAAGELDSRMRQATGIAKAPFVAEFVRMLVESGEKVLLGGWHHAVYDIWMDKLKDLHPVRFTGEETGVQKEEARMKFIKGSAQVMLMSLRSGAGLDGLQSCCSTVVFGELDWSPAVHEQFIGRANRDGQQRPVMAYYCIADDGADPVMAEVLGVKELQSSGLRGQERAGIFGDQKTSEHHIRKLAESVLAKRNRGVTAKQA